MKSLIALTTVVAALSLAAPSHAAIKTRELEYQQDGTTLQGYVAWDDAIKAKRPGVKQRSEFGGAGSELALGAVTTRDSSTRVGRTWSSRKLSRTDATGQRKNCAAPPLIGNRDGCRTGQPGRPPRSLRQFLALRLRADPDDAQAHDVDGGHHGRGLGEAVVERLHHASE